MEIMGVTQVNIVGGSIVGNLLTALCFGVLTIQTSSYYRAFPNDARSLKLIVGFLWTLEAFQLACGTQSLYWWIVTNYNNPSAVGYATWEFATFQIIAACTSFTVQEFLAHRVYSLSANIYLGVLVQVLVLVQFGFGAATSVTSNMALEFVVEVKEWRWVAVSWLATQPIADIVIAICMCLLLRRRRTGFQKTDSVINRMVLYTINTGLVTSVLSCIVLAMYAKYGMHFSVHAIGLPLGGFYSVTMLANLHMRTMLRARLDTPSPLELISLSIKKRMQGKPGDPRNEERPQVTQINIAREVVRDDVDIKHMPHQNGATKIRFTGVQSPVLGGS